MFQNPPGDAAGRLIEACGLKGTRIGGAVVSPVHANFFTNPDGVATAADVNALGELCRERVRDQFGISLQYEVQRLGDWGDRADGADSDEAKRIARAGGHAMTRQGGGRKLRVGVLFGGQSSEHAVSIASAQSVIAALDPETYEIVPIGITRAGQWLTGGDPMRTLLEAGGQLSATPPPLEPSR